MKRGTLYIGFTTDLAQRIYQHKNKLIEGFTEKYSVDKLVYYEEYKYVNDAIERETKLKNWKRYWKIELIESTNPEWIDLYETLF